MKQVVERIIDLISAEHRWGIPERLVAGKFSVGHRETDLVYSALVQSGLKLSVIVPHEPSEQERDFLQTVIERGFGLLMSEVEILVSGGAARSSLLLCCGVEPFVNNQAVRVLKTLAPSQLSQDTQAKRQLWAEIKKLREEGALA